jgi:Holliday junction DNA helicase RuvA
VIDSISGDVVRKGPDFVVVDVGGVAYQASCSTDAVRGCEIGHAALLYIHLALREDTIQLYGFSTLRERELFRLLLTVGQVGPKLALHVLSTLPPQELVTAIAGRDIERLTTVKGVGRKTAERILVDLRDKIAGPGENGADAFILSSDEETALRALTSRSLGFSPREAREALGRLRNERLPAKALVRRALEILGTRA